MSTPKSKTRKAKDVAPVAAAFGERGENVSALQTFLRDHGYPARMVVRPTRPTRAAQAPASDAR